MRDLSEALASAGMDPRTWLSFGTVDAGTQTVDFDEDLGPLVLVTLQPSQIDVYCMVSQTVAGDGEGEFSPWVPGDTVLVGLVGGTPTGGPVILGRFNNTTQKWPTSVGGQDATKNTFAFRRSRTPVIHEYAGSFLIRQSPSGAMLSFDSNGTLVMKDGSGGGLQMSPDLFGYQNKEADCLFQIDTSGKRAMLQVGGARFILADSSASPPGSSVMTPNNLTLMSGSNAAGEHAVSTEAVYNILANWMTAIGLMIAAIPDAMGTGIPIALGALFATPATSGLSTSVPIAAVTPIDPLLALAILGAFSSALPKDPNTSTLGGYQTAPGIGCSSTLIG